MVDHKKSVVRDYFSPFESETFDEGKMILYADEEPRGVMYLEEGVVRQFVASESGKELTLSLLFPGSFFPLPWIINNELPTFNLIARTTSIVKVAPKEEFLIWFMKNPDVIFSTTSRLVSAISGLSKRIEIDNLSNASKRVKSMLSYFARHMGQIQPSGEVFINKAITHDEIASFTGLTRERVSIEMKKLKDLDMVDYSRGIIAIKSPHKLFG